MSRRVVLQLVVETEAPAEALQRREAYTVEVLTAGQAYELGVREVHVQEKRETPGTPEKPEAVASGVIPAAPEGVTVRRKRRRRNRTGMAKVAGPTRRQSKKTGPPKARTGKPRKASRPK